MDQYYDQYRPFDVLELLGAPIVERDMKMVLEAANVLRCTDNDEDDIDDEHRSQCSLEDARRPLQRRTEVCGERVDASRFDPSDVPAGSFE